MQSLTLLLALFAITLFGCKKEADEVSLRTSGSPAPILKVEASEQQQHIKVNETVALQVFFQVTNGCGEFGKFETYSKDQHLTIKVYPHYREGFCTQALETRQTSYSFKAETPGTYTLKFWAGEDNFIIKEIQVSR